MQDIYTWQVIYKDGSILDELELGSFVYVASGLAKSISLLADGVAIHQVAIPDDAEPVFFRRRTLVVNVMNDDQRLAQDKTIHCIGWKQGDDGVYLFVMGDGSTLLSSDLQAV